MRTRLLAFATALACLPAVAADPPRQKIDSPIRQEPVPDRATPLEGTYAVVSGEKDGEPIPAERIRGAVVRITENEMIGTDKDKKELFASTYTVDATTKPDILVKMTTKKPVAGTEATGLIKRDGDTLTIVYNLPGGPVPTTFKTEKGQHLFVLKRTVAPEAVQEKLKQAE